MINRKIPITKQHLNEPTQTAAKNNKNRSLPTAHCYLLFFTFYLFLSAPCFAENEFSLRAAPTITAPLSIREFSAGLGATASLDWAFWNFAKDFDLGVSVSGSFASLPFGTGDPLTLLAGEAGPFVRWRPFERWAFRADLSGGVYQYSRNEESAANPLLSFALGAEFHLSPYFSLFADAGPSFRVFSSKPLNSFGAAVGIRFNLSEIMGGRARVNAEKTRQHNVFPVSWAWYENNPVATVKITNEEPNAITDVNLSFFMDSYMSQPWTFAVLPRLAQGESIDVPVTALFNEAMMNLNETVNAHGILQTQYRSLGAHKVTGSSIQMPIFRRNTLSWDDDRRAAAFVSPNDFAVRYFARYIETAISNKKLQGTPPNVLYAAALFEALRLYGISYIIDPASSYIDLSENAEALDTLFYPYETLHYRGGDCDDLSILFCSLLEALDIETAFITVPGHIYVAFETGDDFWYAQSDNIIDLDGKRWLPVEITVPREGFTRAWRVGARQWRRAGKEAALFPIREAWNTYPSVTVPASGDHLPDLPEWDAIIKAMEKEVGLFR